jgi:uncharacterized repeat protein (TIGR01451 family)
VDLSDDPKLGSFDSAANRTAVGIWAARYSSPDPGVVALGAELNGADVVDSRDVEFFGVDLRLRIDTDNNEITPQQDADVSVTVTNSSAHDATGVEVRATLPNGWTFATILESEAGSTYTDENGLLHVARRAMND